jgi:DNA-binding PadR family transcriptional regulator
MTGAELAILGLIAEKARHGYEIDQIIEQRDMRQWTEIGFSSIYYVLKRLEKAGWVRSRFDPDNQQGPARKVYELTVAGYAAWREAILNVLATPQPHYDPFQLGLSSLPAVGGEEALAALRDRREKLNQTLVHVRTRREAAQQIAPPHVDAMFDLSLTLLEAEVQWLERFILRLSKPS